MLLLWLLIKVDSTCCGFIEIINSLLFKTNIVTEQKLQPKIIFGICFSRNFTIYGSDVPNTISNVMPLFGIKCHSNAHFLFRCAWSCEHLISRTNVRTNSGEKKNQWFHHISIWNWLITWLYHVPMVEKPCFWIHRFCINFIHSNDSSDSDFDMLYKCQSSETVSHVIYHHGYLYMKNHIKNQFPVLRIRLSNAIHYVEIASLP